MPSAVYLGESIEAKYLAPCTYMIHDLTVSSRRASCLPSQLPHSSSDHLRYLICLPTACIPTTLIRLHNIVLISGAGQGGGKSENGPCMALLLHCMRERERASCLASPASLGR